MCRNRQLSYLKISLLLLRLGQLQNFCYSRSNSVPLLQLDFVRSLQNVLHIPSGLSTLGSDNVTGCWACVGFGNCLHYRFFGNSVSPDVSLCPALCNFALNVCRLAISQSQVNIMQNHGVLSLTNPLLQSKRTHKFQPL